MTFLGRSFWSCDCRVVILLLIIDIRTIGNKLHRVLINLPLGRERLVFGRDLSGDFCIPARESIARLGEICRSRQFAVIVLLLHHVSLAISEFERHGVLIDFPLCRESFIGGWNLGRNGLVPTLESVTCSGWRRSF